MDVNQAYQDALQRKHFSADPAQELAVARLQQLYDDLVAFKAARTHRIRRLLSAPLVPRGVYLYGGVGRGKSFLMDSFFSAVPVVRKTRIHFHEFMRAVHHELDGLKGTEDPLQVVATRLAKRYRVICFDEFHISDIADAMILHRLLQPLFELGVVFVMTSNYAPDGLYPDGLHRDRLLPAIDLIKEHLDVLNVDHGVDYRKRSLERMQTYFTPLGAQADAALRNVFTTLAEAGEESPTLTIESRELKALRRAGGIVWFDFATLCQGPRSQNDYLEIAQQFHSVIVSSVPQMSAGMSSEARRFTWLVDVFYDHHIKLFLSAEVAPELLYTAGALANEFERTVSRIIEMQSSEYLTSDRRTTFQSF